MRKAIFAYIDAGGDGLDPPVREAILRLKEKPEARSRPRRASRAPNDAEPVVLTLSPEELTAIKLSLRVATWATLASLPLGILVAMILARGRFYGRALLNALVLLPLVLPPVVTGYVLLLLFGRHGPLGRWLDTHLGIVFAFRWTGAALACAIMGFPLMVRAIQLSAAAVDRRLEQAAGTLGANPAYVFLTVTLPLMAPASSPAPFSPSPAPWESSARPSPSSPIFPARRRRCRR